MKLTVSDNDENDNDGLIYRTNSITYSFQDSLLWAMNMYMNGIKNIHYDFYFVSKMLNRDGTFLNLVLLWSFLNFNQEKDIKKYIFKNSRTGWA